MATQLETLKAMAGISQNDTTRDTVLNAYLDTAKWAILNRRYPTGTPDTELETRYLSLQVRAALELFAKEGAEGETSHEENGIKRTYDGSGISSSLLREVVPKAKVVT